MGKADRHAAMEARKMGKRSDKWKERAKHWEAEAYRLSEILREKEDAEIIPNLRREAEERASDEQGR